MRTLAVLALLVAGCEDQGGAEYQIRVHTDQPIADDNPHDGKAPVKSEVRQTKPDVTHWKETNIVSVEDKPTTAGWAFKPTHDEGAELREKYPGYSWCHRCGKPWPVAGGEHVINYRVPVPPHDDDATVRPTGERGCFPTCKACWQKSDLNERLTLARMLVEEWKQDEGKGAYPIPVGQAESNWLLIEQAIRDEWNATHEQ